MHYTSIGEMLRSSASSLRVNGGVRVSDEAAFRADVIDRLAHTAVFGDAETMSAAR